MAIIGQLLSRLVHLHEIIHMLRCGALVKAYLTGDGLFIVQIAVWLVVDHLLEELVLCELGGALHPLDLGVLEDGWLVNSPLHQLLLLSVWLL